MPCRFGPSSCRVKCYWGTQYLLLIPLSGLVTCTTAFAWRASLKIHGMERLGLRTEFWRHHILAPALVGMSMALNVLMDYGILAPVPYGHSIASAGFLLTCTSRFMIL